ncbi:hypothetical protein L1987_02020 [Smallanthus sonchifolius]|uniref:Uncharacterized protein n=1 Tax=Smallanthus sonchifolius TaxID=185202 RepID=A0ACB9K6N4_9ASTR|nr:hypothetical protein L1987_02020 [Smallanthus sonchifolius]
MYYHRDADLDKEVGEQALGLIEYFKWPLDFEEFLDEPDEYGDEMPDDLLEMMAELEDIIGTTPSVGKLVEVVEDPEIRGKNPPVIESSGFRLLKTPSVGRFTGDKLLGYLNHIIFRPGRYKLWWKDLSSTCNMSSVFDRSLKVLKLWRTGRPRRMKAVPVRIKEKPPGRLV